MEDYKPNSHKYKREQQEAAEQKRATKVVTGQVRTQKKSEFSKFMGNFVAEDLKSVSSHVCSDVLIPGVKKILYDVLTGGLNTLLFGGRGIGSNSGSVASRVSYRDCYTRSYDDRRPLDRPRAATAYSYDDIIFESRSEAVEVLTRMDELMEKYKMVRVADLYDLVGMTGNYTDNKYGWTNIASAEIVPVAGGYMIRLPRAMAIE